MTDRPIMFAADMVRAILDGKKTQTRRLASSPLRKAVPLDRLWVRETFGWYSDLATPPHPVYRADHRGPMPDGGKWTPCIHMPRVASRIMLEVTAIKFERLQEISEMDALAEGIDPMVPDSTIVHGWQGSAIVPTWRYENPVPRYQALWESLHGPLSWAENPFIVCLEFRRIV